jgi:hypothetical protein
MRAIHVSLMGGVLHFVLPVSLQGARLDTDGPSVHKGHVLGPFVTRPTMLINMELPFPATTRQHVRQRPRRPALQRTVVALIEYS